MKGSDCAALHCAALHCTALLCALSPSCILCRPAPPWPQGAELTKRVLGLQTVLDELWRDASAPAADFVCPVRQPALT